MNIEQKFNEQFQKELESRVFVPEDLPYEWRYNAASALRHASPMSLGISAEEFETLVEITDGPRSMTLYQFAILNNNLEKTTPHQLELYLTDYCKLMIETNRLAKQWAEAATPIREELQAKLTAEIEAEQKKSGRVPFKPVKAEA